jgi:hypothetical protein
MARLERLTAVSRCRRREVVAFGDHERVGRHDDDVAVVLAPRDDLLVAPGSFRLLGEAHADGQHRESENGAEERNEIPCGSTQRKTLLLRPAAARSGLMRLRSGELFDIVHPVSSAY